MSQRNFMWKSLIGVLCITIAMIFMIGCEGDQGPAGPAGPAGDDGAAGSTACLDCHSTDAMTEISIQYDRSGHALGAYVDYAGGRVDCARCHSGNGFVEYAENGSVEGDLVTPVAIGCNACHAVHSSFEEADFALRSTAAVTIIADDLSTFDFGDNSNLCANCHQSRRPEPNIETPGTTYYISSTHYGPHHGAQANVLNGTGFAEIAGAASYGGTNYHLNNNVTCVTCHMAEYEAFVPETATEDAIDGVGGHTWRPVESLCNDCHGATDGFDHGGVMTAVHADLIELRDLLVTTGVLSQTDENDPATPADPDDDTFEPIKGTYDMVLVQAFFNWIGLEEDRSMGAHNPNYVEALLANSIDAVEAWIVANP